MMVEENILKLEIKRLRDMLNQKSDSVLSLEKRRLQLETAMKERRNEIDIHKEMLTAQLRAADDERQTISAELHERIAKIDKLRKR
jgi:UDP-glucose:O-linked fucose beta-1,3-glucosyltransferase